MAYRSVFITGGAAGIGRAIADRFLGDDWKVGIIDRDARALAMLPDSVTSRAWIGTADVSDADGIRTALEAFMAETGGRLDVLVNNAGLVAAGDFEAMDAARYTSVVDVNVKGVINSCLAAYPFLEATPNARVINLCSASAAYGTPGYAVYSATKFAVRGLTEALEAEWHRHDIKVMAVWPLFVNTAMVSQVGRQATITRLGVRLQPEDVAKRVLRAAQAPRWLPIVHWTVGWQGLVMVQLTRFLPAWANRVIARVLADY